MHLQLDADGQTVVEDPRRQITGGQLASNLTLAGTTSGTFSGPLAGNVTGSVNAPVPALTCPLPSMIDPDQSTSTCRENVAISVSSRQCAVPKPQRSG